MNYIFTKINNTNLVIFRIFFGLLMTVECWGAIATGWVSETFVKPDFTFTFIGFEWTHFLLGEPMYWIYIVMGFLGILIALGAVYRISAVLFFLLWSLTYFMQKSHYNNHYYLLVLVSFLMCIVPAHRSLSIDAQMNYKIRSHLTERWTILIFKIQVFFVYTFAAVAKLHPGWYDDHFLPLRLKQSARWFQNHFDNQIVIDFIRSKELAHFLALAGIGFDFLIVPLLLIKQTRKWAFLAAVIFHLFNSITLQIGIFPYFALALCLFFFSPREITRIFIKSRKSRVLNEEYSNTTSHKKLKIGFVVLFTLWQLYLPLRHWLIPGDVLWTEEGHRLAWRMMLRTKSGRLSIETHLPDGKVKKERLSDYLKPHQIGDVRTKPDMMWQFAQHLKRKYQKEGYKNIEVFVKNSKLKINDGPYHNYIDPNIDLANEKWSYFGHQRWIFPEPENYYSPKK